jgi:dihydrofolate synthase/folylpolyglutamate synthase
MIHPDTTAFLDGLVKTGIRPGLSRIRRLMARLDHPERAFPAVLITGTNGKGSTAAFLDAMLRAAGLRIGLFTSPHLVDVRERIRIDGALIDPTHFDACVAEVREGMMGGPPGARRIQATYFEALTATGYLAFAREGVDLAVVEVGMGGRLDSTNVIDPLVSVLTNISLDHQQFLGDTVDTIAVEKIGVCRRDRTLVTAIDDALFQRTLAPILRRRGVPVARLGHDFLLRRSDRGLAWQGRADLPDLVLGLPGAFQIDNAALALATIEALADYDLRVDAAAIRAGLAAASWPGRMQVVARSPTVVLDGCHNPGAAARLAETLDEGTLPRPLVLVHATKPEKDFGSVLDLLAPRCDAVIETHAPGLANPTDVLPRAVAAARPGTPVLVDSDLASAVRQALALAGPNGSVLIAGSLYLVGAALARRPWEAP